MSKNALIGSEDVVQLLNQGGTNVYMVNISKQPNPYQKPLPYSVDEAAVRLVKLGVPKDDARILQKQDVDGEALAYLNDDNLLKMGIPTFGRRVKILRCVQDMIREVNPPDAKSAVAGARALTEVSRALRGSGPPDDEEDRSTALVRRDPLSGRDREREREREELARRDVRDRDLPKRPSSAGREREERPRYRSDEEDEGRDRRNGGSDASDDDSDTERDFEHPRAKKEAIKAKVALRGSGAGDEDDMFATEDAGRGVEFMAVKPWLGAIVAPSNAPKNNANPPDKQLRLEWAHGYRAFDSRSNLVYNGQGDIVYPVAGIVVVYRVKSRSQKHFFGHSDDVRCLSQHPTNLNIIATGQNATIIKGKGAPPHICVWDSTDFSRNYILKLTQQDRAVRSVGFSGDGRYLASVSNDDNHTVRVFDWEKRSMVASAKGDTSPIFLIKGNQRDPREFVTVGKRHCMFWMFDGHKLVGKRGQTGTTKSITFYSVAFSEKGYACLGGEDGSIYVFAGGKVAKVFENIHKGKVFSIDYYPGGLVSGGGDGRVNVLDKKMDVAKSFKFSHKINSVHIRDENLLVGTQGAEVFEVRDWAETDIESDDKLDPVTRGHYDGELWALGMAPDGKHFVTAGEDNLICLWEVAGHRLLKRGIINEKRGKAPAVKKASTTSQHPTNQCARAVAISPNNKHIIVGCNNGEVNVYDTRTMSRLLNLDLNKYGKRNVENQTGNWIQSIKYSPSGHTVAVGTHGSVIVLLDVTDGYKPKGLLKSSNASITHLDWSADGTYVQSNDGAYELLFYSIDEGDLKSSAQVTSASAMRDTKWATQNCILGWSVQGIFDPSQDGTDVNSVDASPSRTLAVTGDDSGNVNLFRFPVAAKGNKSNTVHAHASHVPTVRFTADERYVISTGGHDLSIMQWAVVSPSTR